MKAQSIIYGLVTVALIAIGAAGSVFGYQTLAAEGPWFLTLGLALAAYLILHGSYRKPAQTWPPGSSQPAPLRLRRCDYVKALICWLDSFSRTYAVKPGLYYTGPAYDRNTPLLVTANYHLTVFLLVRRLRCRNVRLLVVDTDSINVWCAAGKGSFSSEAIIEQLRRYKADVLAEDEDLRLILPKLCLSGVNLAVLQEAGYKPVIGPVYCRDIHDYLAKDVLDDCDSHRVRFGLRSRLFTLPPGMLQILKYVVKLLLVMWLFQRIWPFKLPVTGVLVIIVSLKVAYTILFPYLPGKWFAAKGFWLALFACFVAAGLAAGGLIALRNLPVVILFTLASGMYLGQYYSGSSAVSNVTSVRKETARLLPAYVLLYLASLVAFVLKEVI